METTMTAPNTTTATVISAESLLAHWLGHRNVTRKVIDAFPEKELFTHTIGGMRPFAELTKEMLGMASPIARGVATGKWEAFPTITANTKQELLDLWDEETEKLKAFWAQIPLERFGIVDVAFGQYENVNINTIFYGIDNEIHHRGQGYVYLRSLGITPPFFWDRD